MIRLNDLRAQHDSIKEELDRAIEKVIYDSKFIGGEQRDSFEKNFASYCGKKYCIGASNGSTALFTTLKCLNIKEGDEVIVPVNTFIATAFAVTLCKAKPIFVDVNEKDHLMNTNLIEEKITDKTKAIIPVHLYGAVCDMDKIKEISEKHNIFIIEDCAQAHGSKYKGKRVPVYGLGCFSFFPAKNLGALGDSGAIVCDDTELASKLKMFVNHGRKDKYLHEQEGFNFRMNNLQAALLDVKLGHLNSWIEKKQEIAERYDEKLNNLKQQKIDGDSEHSHYVYVIRSDKRDTLQKYLEEKGIETVIHYPVPLHLQPAFSNLNHEEGDFPIAEKLSKEILSIPMHPFLKEEDQEKIVVEINEFLKSASD